MDKVKVSDYLDGLVFSGTFPFKAVRSVLPATHHVLLKDRFQIVRMFKILLTF